ncbi:zinc ABC transporter substrate-binding protein [uncultured Litoreibacter sp.]|uniref:zinc ABC transporter substrate-binding protein n=1 Tax=uncultured Litoreibacter sp. TaxID=1392394 RepID=UPI002621775B|nr:zinc ABC transporter substrate-binding protein [uncultured Litoreibacter sp.]
MLRPTLTSLFLSLPAISLAETPRVVADIAPVHSLVAQVMGDLGTPDLLVTGSASPHSFSLRPSQAHALEQADLVIFVAEDLTSWLEPVLDRVASKAEHLELLHLPQTQTLDFRTGVTFAAHDHADHEEHKEHEGHDDHAGHDDHKEHEGHDDHAGHDDHKEHEGHDDHAGHDDHKEHEGHDDHAGHDDHNHDGVDPHAWLNPDNASAWLDVIASELSEHDPANAAAYAANAKAAKERLAATVVEVENILTPAKGKNFIVFHDAYHYFEARFGIEARAAISISDASSPGPARVEEIQKQVHELKVTCAFSEPQFSDGLVNTVLDGTDANTAILDPLGASLKNGADLYGKLLVNMATAIADC